MVAPRCPSAASSFLPDPAWSILRADGRRRGGQSSNAACASESLACCCPRISRGKDPSIYPLTSDLHDPDPSLGACPERSGRQAGCILQWPGAVPWGHCSSTATQACESLWEGASRRVAATCPGRGTPEDFTEEATELGGWVWKEEEVVSGEKEDGGSIPGRTRTVSASLDHACPVLGQRGRLGPEQPLREDPTGQAHCSSFPNGNFFFWDIHIIAKMNHTERTACMAAPPIPVTMGTTGCVSFQTFPTFRWMWSLPTCWCTNGFFPFTTDWAVSSQKGPCGPSAEASEKCAVGMPHGCTDQSRWLDTGSPRRSTWCLHFCTVGVKS